MNKYSNHIKSLYKLNQTQANALDQYKKYVSDKIYNHEKINCKICNSNDFKIILDNDRYGIDYKLVICNKCGLLYCNPRLDKDSLKKFYEKLYRKLYSASNVASKDFFSKQYKKGELIYKQLEPHIKNLKETLIVEIGCGAGGILKYFNDKGCETKGYDLNEKYIQYGKEQYNLDLNYGSIDSVNRNIRPNVIIYADVLEHIPDINEELVKIHSALAENGILFIKLPGIKYLHFSYGMDIKKIHQNAHLYNFSLKTLNNILVKNNFKLIWGTERIESLFRKEITPNNFKDNDIQKDKYIRHYLSFISLMKSLHIRIDKYRLSYLKIREKVGGIIRRIIT